MSSNWYVLTGAPSSGKTTTAKILAQRGFKVVPEAARLYIDHEISKGKTIDQIRSDEIEFQHQILKIKIKAEQEIQKEQITFFDRAIPDSLAYYELWRVEADDILKRSLRKCFYKKAFLLKSHAFLKDYARVESEEQAKQLENLLKRSYEKLKIPVVEVPVMTVEERVNFILNEANR